MAGRILLIDDELKFAKMVTEILRKSRYQVDMQTSPEDGLLCLKERHYNLIITDFKMPEMDGDVFMKALREIIPDIPVIMISGLMNKADLVNVANLGINLILEKPFKTETLLENVSRYVEPLSEDAEIEGTDKIKVEVPNKKKAKTRVKNYPKDLCYLVDSSLYMQDFIQDLWETVNQSNHIFITASKGAEFELILREISQWKGYNNQRSHIISAVQLKSPQVIELLDQTATDPEISNIIGVIDVEKTKVEQQLYLLNFILNTSEKISRAKNLVFVYRNLNPDFIDLNKVVSPTPLQLHLSDNSIKLPELSERHCDIATYVKRYIDLVSNSENRSGKKVLTEDAIKILLSYEWPGNFNELINTLRRCVLLGSKENTTSKDIEKVILRNNGTPPDISNFELNNFLKESQKKYLTTIQESMDDDLSAALSAVGVEDVTAGNQGLDALALIYPTLD